MTEIGSYGDGFGELGAVKWGESPNQRVRTECPHCLRQGTRTRLWNGVKTPMGKQLSGAGLSSSERAAMQDLLTEDRESTMIQIAALTRDWDGIIESATLVANDDEHDPEGATLAFERAHLESLLDKARSRLEDLDQMSERLREGTYGVCENCGRPIAFERLKARPVARTCIECAAHKR